jgi:hypothetical protein
LEGAWFNLGQDTGYPNWDILWVSSFPPGTFQDNTAIKPQPFPSKSFPNIIHQSSYRSVINRLDQWFSTYGSQPKIWLQGMFTWVVNILSKSLIFHLNKTVELKSMWKRN